MYESRIVSVGQHLELNKSHNITLQFVVEQEQNDIVRLKEKLLRNYEIEWEDNTTPNNLSKVFTKADIGSQRKRYNAKVMHGYYEKKLEQDPGIDRSLSFLWKKRSLCNIRVRKLLISNSRPRASNKILAIQTGPRQR